MRTPVRSILSVVTLGVLASSYQIGQAATTNAFNTASAQTDATSAAPSASASASASASPSASATASASATPSAIKTATKTTASKPAATATKSSTPTPTATKTSAPAAAPAASGTTQTSGLVQYRYGMIQLSVTKNNGKITDVGLVTATATAGRDQAFSYLVDYAVQSNGSGFGNLSGATFTTVAFKKALDQALAKF